MSSWDPFCLTDMYRHKCVQSALVYTESYHQYWKNSKRVSLFICVSLRNRTIIKAKFRILWIIPMICMTHLRPLHSYYCSRSRWICKYDCKTTITYWSSLTRGLESNLLEKTCKISNRTRCRWIRQIIEDEWSSYYDTWRFSIAFEKIVIRFKRHGPRLLQIRNVRAREEEGGEEGACWGGCWGRFLRVVFFGGLLKGVLKGVGLWRRVVMELVSSEQNGWNALFLHISSKLRSIFIETHWFSSKIGGWFGEGGRVVFFWWGRGLGKWFGEGLFGRRLGWRDWDISRRINGLEGLDEWLFGGLEGWFGRVIWGVEEGTGTSTDVLMDWGVGEVTVLCFGEGGLEGGLGWGVWESTLPPMH